MGKIGIPKSLSYSYNIPFILEITLYFDLQLTKQQYALPKDTIEWWHGPLELILADSKSYDFIY